MRHSWRAFVVGIALGSTVALVTTSAGAAEVIVVEPAACWLGGVIRFKPSLVATIPPKSNGKPGRDRRVKVTITGLLANCALGTEASTTDDDDFGGGELLKATGSLPSRLLDQLDDPVARTVKRVKFTWFGENAESIAPSRNPGPDAMTWTITSPTTVTLAGTFADTSKSFGGASFEAHGDFPPLLPGPISNIGFDSHDFLVTRP